MMTRTLVDLLLGAVALGAIIAGVWLQPRRRSRPAPPLPDPPPTRGHQTRAMRLTQAASSRRATTW